VTYSIVARDPDDGSLAIGIQSAWFAVGHICTWVNAGVGVVATQAFADPTYGPRGLTLMRNGLTAPKALESLVDLDTGRESRQVAMVDNQGNVGVHTGSSCLEHAEHTTRNQASCQGNILAQPGTTEAMMAAYESASGELVDRVLAALKGAEDFGGDARGSQSAALLVVRGQGDRDLFEDRMFDVRIDDHPDPISELFRIVNVQRAYRQLDLSERYLLDGKFEVAAEMVLDAARLLPHDVNVLMIGIEALIRLGRDEDARRLAAGADDSAHLDWPDLITRMAGREGGPANAEHIQRMIDLFAEQVH
jgi:uncharacterized Ntn-hydrolase superfamily protein